MTYYGPIIGLGHTEPPTDDDYPDVCQTCGGLGCGDCYPDDEDFKYDCRLDRMLEREG